MPVVKMRSGTEAQQDTEGVLVSSALYKYYHSAFNMKPALGGLRASGH